MRVFKSKELALKSRDSKPALFLNSDCPYSDTKDKLCGNWCSLFYFFPEEHTEEVNVTSHVILGCKAGEKLLYVTDVVGD